MTAAPRETLCNCSALRQAARQVTQMYDDALAGTGLRVTQYSVLATLERVGPTSLQDLAAGLVIDRSTLGHNLRPLEREGLVELARDENDRRSRRLVLTASGKRRLESARPAWQRAQQGFESRYGKSEAQQLRRMLRDAVAAAGADS